MRRSSHVGTSHPVTGDRRTATSRGLTGWWATGVPDSPAQRWVIGPRRVFCTHSVPVTATPDPWRSGGDASTRGGRRAVWVAGFVSPATCTASPPTPGPRASSPRAALPLALDPAGIRRPACHFYNTINLGSIGSDRLPPPRLASFSTPRLPPRAPSLLAFSPSTSPSSRRPRCPPGTEPVSPPLTLSLSSKQVVLSRQSSATARLQLRPDPAPFPPFAGAVPPCVLCLLAALVSAGQGGGCRCSGWSVPSFPSSRGCEGRSARGSLRASFFLLADC